MPFLRTLFSIAVAASSLSLHAQAPVPNPPIAPRASRYLSGAPIAFSALLAPPPAPNSEANQYDLFAVHMAESTRTPAQVANAQRDDHNATLFAFDTVLGPGFNAASLPLTAALSQHLRAESALVNPPLKAIYHRVRPYNQDATLHPVCDKADPDSYPSGHSLIGYLDAYTLAEMLPGLRSGLLARAEDFAHNRIICGVHFPTDTQAAHTMAAALFGALSTSAKFQQELVAAAAEIRARLSLQ